MQNSKQLEHCKNLSCQMSFAKDGKTMHLPLSLHPLTTKRSRYDFYCQLQRIWHRVLLKVSQDKHFLINLLTPAAQNDPLLRGNLDVLKKRNGRPLLEGASFSRIDYFEDKEGQPKVIQYNLSCVGGQAHIEIIQQKRHAFQNDSPSFKNSIVSNITEAVCDLAKLKMNAGIALYVTYNLQKLENEDFCKYDWWKFQQQFAKRQTKLVATNLKQMAEKLSLRENGDLYFGEERVAIVYYRTVFRITDYNFGQEGDFQRSFAAKEMANRSNAINVPPIELELTNLKRVQTELGKPEVLRRYATLEEAETLMKARVREWDFDSISKEDFQSLRAQVQANPNKFVLKPNCEGGGNNSYGQKIIDKLRDEHDNLSSYILMEKINAQSYHNTFIKGQTHFSQDSNYEIGIYGCMTWNNGQILRNEADGYMIKAKSTQTNEGGISMGFGRIVLWQFEENDN